MSRTGRSTEPMQPVVHREQLGGTGKVTCASLSHLTGEQIGPELDCLTAPSPTFMFPHLHEPSSLSCCPATVPLPAQPPWPHTKPQFLGAPPPHTALASLCCGYSSLSNQDRDHERLQGHRDGLFTLLNPVLHVSTINRCCQAKRLPGSQPNMLSLPFSLSPFGGCILLAHTVLGKQHKRRWPRSSLI